MGVNNITGLRECLEYAHRNHCTFTDTCVDNDLLEALLDSYDQLTEMMSQPVPSYAGTETIPGPDGQADVRLSRTEEPAWVTEAETINENAWGPGGSYTWRIHKGDNCNCWTEERTCG